MKYPLSDSLSYEEIQNGALILELVRNDKTWERLCSRYAYADPAQLVTNTTSMMLLKQLREMREAGLISFEEEQTPDGPKPLGEIKDTGLWSRIRVTFGGMSLSEAALLSRHAKGVAVIPVFGRPAEVREKIDVFTLMPFNSKMQAVYTNHIKKLGDELGISIRRADENFFSAAFHGKSLGRDLRLPARSRRLHREEPQRLL